MKNQLITLLELPCKLFAAFPSFPHFNIFFFVFHFCLFEYYIYVPPWAYPACDSLSFLDLVTVSFPI